MASQSQDNDEPASPTPNLIAEASLIQQTGIPTSQAAEASTRRRPQNEAADAALQGNAETSFEAIDEGGELVRVRFLEFLDNYSQVVCDAVEDEEGNTNSEEAAQRDMYPYRDQAELIARRQTKVIAEDEDDEDDPLNCFSSTICVNYKHLQTHDVDLAEAIEGEFVRFEPFLRRAALEFMKLHHPELDGTKIKSYFVALYNAPSILPVRTLRTGTVGRFVSISGTVTRSSDVRPELLVGSFRCKKCGLLAPPVMQQYHLTRPALCRNPRCQNRSSAEFLLELGEGEETSSEFVDWQRLRVQENADEIPPGSMPRTIDAVVRNEMVERAKAGDRIVLTGSLVVVPDGSALARAGEAARATIGDRGKEAASGGGGGVKGLGALGVRELTYRTCFVAVSVLPAEVAFRIQKRGEDMDAENAEQELESKLFGMAAGVSGGWSGGDHPKTSHQVAMEFSEEEKDEIRRMKGMSHLYDKVSSCHFFCHAQLDTQH